MRVNIGPLDRKVRLLIGSVLLIAGFWLSLWLSALGVIMLAVATVRVCPLYLPFGISTVSRDRTDGADSGSSAS